MKIRRQWKKEKEEEEEEQKKKKTAKDDSKKNRKIESSLIRNMFELTAFALIMDMMTFQSLLFVRHRIRMINIDNFLTTNSINPFVSTNNERNLLIKLLLCRV